MEQDAKTTDSAEEESELQKRIDHFVEAAGYYLTVDLMREKANGVHIDALSSSGITALIAAVQWSGRIWTVQELLDNKADVNALSRTGWSPIDYACKKGELNIVRMLIKNKASLSGKRKQIAMYACVDHESFGCLYLLLGDGKTTSSEKMQLLNVARSRGHGPTIYALDQYVPPDDPPTAPPSPNPFA